MVKFHHGIIDRSDKEIWVYEVSNDDDGRCLSMKVDFDDVDHEVIEEKMKRLIAVLNKHW